ncbi:MAG: dihydroneopterin triphosphate diphosphatase [Chromatiales bacterium]|jgi:dATP pyrophosphohydrolase|nr:dihydroneopterin triphosphate diphosphatase [Chromatiales bacterium]
MPRPAFKRPESVLVVVHTGADVLLLERLQPKGFLQSVTGSLEAGESPVDCARRELAEEIGLGVTDGLRDLDLVQRFPIAPAWRHRYAPDVKQNLEHAFALRVDRTFEPKLSASEHIAYRWLTAGRAAGLATSWTNRDAIRRVFGNGNGDGITSQVRCDDPPI